MTSAKGKQRRVVFAAVVVGYVVGTIIAVQQGYSLGKNAVVRCRRGHLFTTVWIPGASVKSLRLGFWRFQWCPVGRHFDLVHPVKTADLTEAERSFALSHHDAPVP
jgi:hypothetical protein